MQELQKSMSTVITSGQFRSKLSAQPMFGKLHDQKVMLVKYNSIYYLVVLVAGGAVSIYIYCTFGRLLVTRSANTNL